MKNTLAFLVKFAAALVLLLAIFQLLQEVFDSLNPHNVKEYVPIYDDEPNLEELWDEDHI